MNSPLMDYLQGNLLKAWKQRVSLKTIRITPKDRAFYCSNERGPGVRFTLCGDFPLATQSRRC